MNTPAGATVRSLRDGVDTSTSTGRMVDGILMSNAEYERELIRERTALKLEHARKSGRKFGRRGRAQRRPGRACQADEGQWGDCRHHLRDVGNRSDNPLPLFRRRRDGVIGKNLVDG